MATIVSRFGKSTKWIALFVVVSASGNGVGYAADIQASSWSEIDASNTAAPPDGWPSVTMRPNEVEPSARAMMGAIKRFYNRVNAVKASAGSANAQTLTYDVAPAAYVTGDAYTFRVGAGLTNTGATTLNVNSLGAKTIKRGTADLTGNEIRAGEVVSVYYDGTDFQLPLGTYSLSQITATYTAPLSRSSNTLSITIPNANLLGGDGSNFTSVTVGSGLTLSGGTLSRTAMACADLSNDGTACTANTGTSGTALPFLDGANTWSGTQTFGTVLGTVATQTGTTYTLQASDCGKTVRFTNGSAITVTTLNSLSAGCAIALLQAGAGQITVAAGAGATQLSAHAYTKTFGQGAILGLFVDVNSGGSAANFIITGDGA